MGFLGSPGLRLELACLLVLGSEGFGNIFLCRSEGEGGKVGRVCPHVGNETPFVEGLGHPHRHSDGEMKFPGSFLLEG